MLCQDLTRQSSGLVSDPPVLSQSARRNDWENCKRFRRQGGVVVAGAAHTLAVQLSDRLFDYVRAILPVEES